MNGDKVSLYTCVDSFQSSATPQQSFCGPKQELNLHSPDGIANTAGHVLILYPTFGSFASLLFLIVG